ncbi:ribose ABC transporter substrate-binding protein RbsB [Marininema halotolerans]|uniref:Ribose transport system substrate-binding protein n=1 Tax=Marininema halotolerans TaxID=1155944 RepID=A0A1I6PMS6_9BACL|nr:ribose ABC transporter substrate-binding protein RbsB [Marininema halotolerans]SFS41511.1 ribose transport system substrate-binding protein [Marininema halotolerans]
MRRQGILLIVAMLLFSMVVGCSTKSALETKEDDHPLKVGLSLSTLNNPFFVSLRDGAKKEAKQKGIELVVADAQDDTAKQASDVEDLIQKKVDILLINPTDSKAVAAAIQSANQAKIPVITVDRAAEGGKTLSHIASDNVEGGKMAGDYLLSQIEDKGKVIELEGIPGTTAARDRGEGFHEALQDHDGVKIVASQPANFDRAKGLTVMENLLQREKGVKAVFAHNDEMALGALEAIRASKKDMIVVGFDATADAVKAVQKGTLSATIAQKPEVIGKKAIDVSSLAAKGKKVDKFYPVPLKLVTKEQ